MTITLNNISCGYGKNALLSGFNASVSSGEIYCLLGPNGSGKTTLFKTILGFLPLISGSITIDGKNAAYIPSNELARHIAYVPQSNAQSFGFSVLDVIVMGRTAYLGAFGVPKKSDYDFAEEVMRRLGISHLRDKLYTELSGGERQMALIARALTQEPDFLMMDEPTSNLDFGNQAKVLEHIILLAENNIGIIMTTHYPEHVLLLQTKAALIKDGNCAETGRARSVLTEKNLSEMYGISVAVAEVEYQNRKLPFCQPVLTERVNIKNHGH